MKAAKSTKTNLPELPSLGIHQLVILVADDEVMIRNLVTLLLQGKGFVVLSASDGQEALELSRSYPGTIDLIITDVEMPRLNGIDLCALLVKERPGIKIVVMSGGDMREIVGKKLNSLFMPKPFDGATLIAGVQGMLASPVQPPKYEQRHVSLETSPGFGAYKEEMRRG